jgi:glutaconate CoA-transferase, subunit B
MSAAQFLIRAAREFRRGGWVFTGFHWPVLAGQLAHQLDGAPFTQVFEAGAGTVGAAEQVPTSTTDYPAYGAAIAYSAAMPDVLLAAARRFDRTVLDASNIDIGGRVNSSFLGTRSQPTVRLPGGGGAPDVAARARELVWLHGGTDLRRIQGRVEHVTAAPGAASLVRLHTRWGVVRLGDQPFLEEVAGNVPGAQAFRDHLDALGVDVTSPVSRPTATTSEITAARAIFEQAAARGYTVGVRALAELTSAMGAR